MLTLAGLELTTYTRLASNVQKAAFNSLLRLKACGTTLSSFLSVSLLHLYVPVSAPMLLCVASW